MKKSLAANLQFSGILYPFNRLLQKTKKEGKPSFFFCRNAFLGVPYSLQKLSDAVHHGDFVLHHTMRVAV